MAALMASGQQIYLAHSVLSCIYHVLGEAASHPDNPGKANVIFPCHYVIGWLAELFPSLYRRRPIAIVLVTFLLLFIMRGCLVANFPDPRLGISSGMEDIFPLELARIARTLVMVGT